MLQLAGVLSIQAKRKTMTPYTSRLSVFALGLGALILCGSLGARWYRAFNAQMDNSVRLQFCDKKLQGNSAGADSSKCLDHWGRPILIVIDDGERVLKSYGRDGLADRVSEKSETETQRTNCFSIDDDTVIAQGRLIRGCSK